jgi:hypothetical protein
LWRSPVRSWARPSAKDGWALPSTELKSAVPTIGSPLPEPFFRFAQRRVSGNAHIVEEMIVRPRKLP